MQAPNSGCYVIENKLNGHRYVGSSVNVPVRLAWHRRLLKHDKHHSRHLQRAWNKYGRDAFDFIFLMICDKSKLLHYEQKLIDAWNPEYNVCRFAGNTLGKKHTPEAKKKMSLSRIGKHPSEETRLRNSLSNKGRASWNKGKSLSEEHKHKVGEASKRSWESKERRERGSEVVRGENNPFYGKKHSEEAIDKIRQSKIGRKIGHFSQEHKDRISQALKGRVFSDEHRKHISEARKKFYHDASIG